MKKGTLMRKWMLRVIGLLVVFTAYLLLEEYVMQVHGTSLAGRLSPEDEKITARIDVSEKTANAAPCFRLIDNRADRCFGKDRQRRAVFPPDR